MLLMAIANSGMQTLTCNRTMSQQVDCKLTQTKFLGLTQGQARTFTNVQSAQINSYTSIDKNGKIFHYEQVLLLTKNQEFPLPYPSNAVLDLNNFIGNLNQTTITIKTANKWPILLPISMFMFSIFLYILLIVMFCIFRIETYTFSKLCGTLTLKRKTLLGTQMNKYLCSELKNVYLRENKNNNSKTYRVCIALSNGRYEYLGLESYNWQEQQEAVELIRCFLNWRDSC